MESGREVDGSKGTRRWFSTKNLVPWQSANNHLPSL
jgi:hypothetical protein